MKNRPNKNKNSHSPFFKKVGRGFSVALQKTGAFIKNLFVRYPQKAAIAIALVFCFALQSVSLLFIGTDAFEPLMDFISPLDAPIININTAANAPIVDKETYLTCSVSITNTTEEFCLSQSSAKVRGRGHNTWTSVKKPYKLKFDNPVHIFGSEYAAREWTLIPNYLDKTLSRNAMALELSSSLDDTPFASIHQFVEVYVNQDYMGLFLLCDQIETGEGRVEVDETYDPITGDGGYLIELDGYAEEDGGVNGKDYFEMANPFSSFLYSYSIKTPDTDSPDYNASVQRAYIQNYMQGALKALYDKDWTTVENLIDVDSFVDAYVVMLLFVPIDCCSDNFYLYKNAGGKLYAGPVWDFDLGSGNVNYAEYGEFSDENYCYPDGSLYVPKANPWFMEFDKNPEFKALVAEKLRRYEENIERAIRLAHPENVVGEDKSYYARYPKAIARNHEKWGTFKVNSNYEPRALSGIKTIRGQFEYLYDWLTRRYEYILEKYPLT